MSEQPRPKAIPKCPGCDDSHFVPAGDDGAPTEPGDELICCVCRTRVTFGWWQSIAFPDAAKEREKTAADIIERLQRKP